MNTEQIIRLARHKLATAPENEGSARVCLADAIACYDKGDLHHARERALRSLSYSVGVLDRDYQRAAASHVASMGKDSE